MATQRVALGYVKGPQGDTGATGPQGAPGAAATIEVGSVTTTAYGNAAEVTNSGTEQAAVLDFIIPQGRPGEQVTQMDNLTINAITQPSDSFPVPAVGDRGSVIIGKITKWFSDMAAKVSGIKATVDALTATATDVTGVANDNNVTGTCSGKRRGYMVTLSVDCVAAKDLTSSGWTLFSGLPASVTQARTTMYNVTKNQPISIGVNTAGNLVMMYAGSLSTGDAVKGGITYITSE